MASISKQPNGRKLIQFTDASGKRRTLRLGKVSLRFATATKLRVESLVTAAITGHAIDDETARWVTALDDVMRKKLASAGLVRKMETATLKAFVESYIENWQVKPLTKQRHRTTLKFLIEFFDPNIPMRDISAGDADDWWSWIRGRVGENTARRRCGRAKEYFRAAIRKGLVSNNPFQHLKSNVQENRSRDYFITREEADKTIEACPDAQWRLLFALSRYGGLRCPSEHLSLRWEDVDWEHERIHVTSPKTEHYEGGESRMIPMFPELRPYLDEGFELAEPGTEFVITRYRDRNSNLRTQLLRIIKRAGLKKWPKLFHNLRATRQTELEETFPSHVVCSWIGNSESIARKHYLQVTDGHFQKALQKALQKAPETSGTEVNTESGTNEDTPVLQGHSSQFSSVHKRIVPPRGFEPLSRD